MINQIFKPTKHLSVFSWFLLLFFSSFAQKNLVPNPSFEQYSNCPNNSTYDGTINGKPDFWYKPDLGGAIYLNVCSNINSPWDGVPYNHVGGGPSYQIPKTGSAYIGMFYYNQNANNYFQIKLFDSLKIGKKYYAEYYVSLENTYLKACNNQAMLFTKQPVYADTNQTNILIANAQVYNYGNPIIADTLGWVKISGIFTAQGGEQYLTLGNFKYANQTKFINFQPFPGYNGAGYYVDDVAVYEINDSFCLKADAGNDTTIGINDSVFIGSYTNGIDTIKWYNAAGQVIDSVQPGFWVKPNAVGSYRYIVEQVVNGCYTRDTVNVSVVLPLIMVNYKLLMINEKQVLNKWETGNEVNVSHYNIQRSTNGKDFKTFGKVLAKGNNSNYEFVDELKTKDQYPKTLYYRLQIIDKDGTITYSEIRNIEFKTQNLKFKIFPNPAKDVVNIECANAKQLLIIDYLGRTIKQLNNITEHQTINTKQFTKGIYTIQIVTKNGEMKTEKLIVE